MADDAGDKTEPATPKRRNEARDRGQVAKSNDLTAAILLLSGMAALRVFAPRMMALMLHVIEENLSIDDPSTFSSVDLRAIIVSIGMITLTAVGPVLLAMAIAAAVSNFMQIGFLFTFYPLQPKLDKLNPITGVTRLFSTKTLVQLGMNLLKLALVVSVSWVAIENRLERLMLAMVIEGWNQIILLSSLLYEVGLRLAAVLLVIALLDFSWQRYKFDRDMRMSKQEVKEEMRGMEGDPVMKQRRRKAQFAAAMQRIQSAVPTADVIVTNPTELAIAIKYDAEEMGSPKVIAKGADFLAKKIREIAILHGVPIVERKPLARMLYKTVEVGQEVPEKLYKAVAEVLAYVYQLSGKSPARSSAASAA